MVANHYLQLVIEVYLFYLSKQKMIFILSHRAVYSEHFRRLLWNLTLIVQDMSYFAFIKQVFERIKVKEIISLWILISFQF